MLAVQFSTKMHKNIIKVPRAYKSFNEKNVHVILMNEESKTSNLSQFAGTIRLREDPVRYQRRKRGEWRSIHT